MRAHARVAVRELRQNLSRYLRRVERGETLEVTERGRPVALLTPLPDAADPLVRLAAEGRIARFARSDLAALPLPEPPAPGEPSLSEALRDVRRDRI